MNDTGKRIGEPRPDWTPSHETARETVGAGDRSATRTAR